MKDESRTPPEFYARLDAEFNFQFDAACTLANRLAPFGAAFDQGRDGLCCTWIGRTFCNPPYSNVMPWVRKAAERFGLSVLLIPVCSDTQWWRDYVVGAAQEIRFVTGKMRFLRPDGTPHKGRLRQGVAVVVYWPEFRGAPQRWTCMPARMNGEALPL